MEVVLFTQSSKRTYSVPIKFILYKVTRMNCMVFLNINFELLNLYFNNFNYCQIRADWKLSLV